VRGDPDGLADGSPISSRRQLVVLRWPWQKLLTCTRMPGP
jgi:hypothetical protein